MAVESRETRADAREVTSVLWVHADATAERALDHLGGALRQHNLETFLRDRSCLRCTTSLRFDGDSLGPEEFAEPEMNGEGDQQHCCLHIHPKYQLHPEAIPHIVAYMAARIIYGDDADAELSERLGSNLLQEPREVFHRRLGMVAHMS